MELAKKYVPRWTVTTKKTRGRPESPPAEASEKDLDSDRGEEGEKIHSFITMY